MPVFQVRRGRDAIVHKTLRIGHITGVLQRDDAGLTAQVTKLEKEPLPVAVTFIHPNLETDIRRRVGGDYLDIAGVEVMINMHVDPSRKQRVSIHRLPLKFHWDQFV